MQVERNGIGRTALRRLGGWTAAALALLSAPAASAATQTYVVTGFDSIRLLAPVRVTLTTGKGSSARGDGSRQMLDRLVLEVSGGVLTVRLKEARPGETSSGPATLALSTDRLSRVQVRGGGVLAIDRMSGLRGDIALNGGGEVSVGAVALDRLNVALMGGGSVTLAGKALQAGIDLSGAGTLAAEGLTVGDARVVSDGSGSAALVATKTAAVNARGAGNVTLGGKAACTVTRAGTGTISCGGKDY
jgi:hypothetical protein